MTFYFMAAIILYSGVVVAWARNLIYSAIGLLFTFVGIAGVYVFAHADFVVGKGLALLLAHELDVVPAEGTVFGTAVDPSNTTSPSSVYSPVASAPFPLQ